MKLLVFANKLNQEDDIMGFLPSWVRAISPSLESVTVIAQYVGVFSLPGNVRVISIDKDKNQGIIKRVVLYWKHLIQERDHYDGIFIVMAPSWAVVSWPLSFILRKKIYLWYAVWRGSFMLHLALAVVDKVFTSVESAFPFKSSKVIPIGQSIDTNIFVPRGDEGSGEGRILFLGRISPVKKIETLIAALVKLQDLSWKLIIAGDNTKKKDEDYKQYLMEVIQRDNLKNRVSWVGKIPHSQVPHFFQAGDIFINLTVSGSFDKTILEAMASGAIVIVSNPALKEFLPSELAEILIFHEGDAIDLSNKIEKVLSLSLEEKRFIGIKLRDIVIQHHSLSQWTDRLIKNL